MSNRFIEALRFVEVVTPEDQDVARLTNDPVKPTEVIGLYTVDLEEVADFNEVFSIHGKVATSLVLRSGRQRTIKMPYKEFKALHSAYFDNQGAIIYKMDMEALKVTK